MTLFIIPTSLFAQFNWKLGGNSNIPPSPVNATNNILGTNINLPIRVVTNGIQRMLIDNGAGGINDGFVAIGNNLPAGFIPLNRLHLHQTSGRNMIRFTVNNLVGGFQIGYNAQSSVLSQQFATIQNTANSAIKFFTTGNIQRMHINQNRISAIGIAGFQYNGINTAGYVGIGNNTTNILGNTTGLNRGAFSLLHLNGGTPNLFTNC